MGDSCNGNAGKQQTAPMRVRKKQPSEERIKKLLEKKAQKKQKNTVTFKKFPDLEQMLEIKIPE